LAPALAQENLDQGKSAAQLYASDCAICHKSPNGLAKSGGLLGLDNFLRQHYTASRGSATVLAKYLQGFANAPEPGGKKRPAKSSDKDKKPGEARSVRDKSSKEKDSKPAEAKDKPKSAAKPESKPEPKAESKPEPKPESKPEAKPEKSD
jgi:hypothetical protein